MEEDADAVSEAEAEIALAEEAVKNLTASMNEGTGASEEAAAQVSEFQAAISGVQEKINALVESYNEAYSAAYESILRCLPVRARKTIPPPRRNDL